MAGTDERYLRELYDKKICPTCAAAIPENGGYGSGRIADGRFCSLDCYGKYHEAAIRKRGEAAIARSRRKQN